jgi:hypothetical protein
MAFLSDNILDSGLDYLDTNGSRLDICSAEPTTYAEATSTNTLGNKTSIAIVAPSDRTGGGRECVVSAITDGSVTGTDTATHFAITDGSSELLATGALSSSQAVTSGNTFTLTEFAVGIPDPA